MGVRVRVEAATRDDLATAATSAVDLAPWRAITAPLTSPDPEADEETHQPDTEPDACGNPRLARVSPSELCQVADCPEVPRLARVYPRHALARTDGEPVAVHSIPGAWAERTALSDEAVPPSRLGLLVHSAVERARLLGGIASDDAADRAMVAEVLSRHGQTEHAAQIEALIVRTLDALRAAVSVLGATREPAREVPFAVDLRGTTLRGVIDLVVESGDALHVIDLKTHALQRDHLARWAGYYQPQLDAYAVALERVTGRKVAGRHLAVPAAGALVTLQSEYDRMSSEEQLFRLGRAMALGVHGPTRDCGRCGWNGECGVGRAILKREKAAAP
ncbi:MAG: PD-(D/E)XK nuclease family protein [Polyangiales bacterium]